MSLNSPEALSLYEDLQKPAKNFTVFVPINSAVVAKVTIVGSQTNDLTRCKEKDTIAVNLCTSSSDTYFSKSLIIHEEKIKEINTVKKV